MSFAKSEASFASPSITETGKLVAVRISEWRLRVFHTWADGMVLSGDVETRIGHLGPESRRVLGDPFHQGTVLFQHIKHLQIKSTIHRKCIMCRAERERRWFRTLRLFIVLL